jgi:transcriptional regulator with GAF, ATPase, and Fis domain
MNQVAGYFRCGMETFGSEELTEALAQLAHAVLTTDHLSHSLERLALLAVEAIPACSAASFAMLVEGEPSTVVVSERAALELDLLQYEAGEGPCIACLGGSAIRIAFVPDDQRFPHFASGAADQRVLSVLSMPIDHQGAVVGSLNLYSRKADGFDEEAERSALVICAEAAVAIASSDIFRLANNVRDRLQNEHDLELQVSLAEGMMMVLHDCSATQARALLEGAAATNCETLLATAQRILALSSAS